MLDPIGSAMGRTVEEPGVPSLPDDYDLDEEEPTDDDIGEPVALAG